MRTFYLLIISVTLGLQAVVQAKRPNVILIVTDDQGYGDMACHGNPWLVTPHIDQLYAESVRLEDYHVDPVCTPTRAALMTGRYCTRVGAWHVVQGRQLLNAQEVTMANVFADSGYRTAMFGKWHLGDPYPYAPRYRGFHEVVCHRAGGVDEIGNPTGNNHNDDIYYRNGQAETFAGYCTDVFFTETMAFIRRQHANTNKQPFFIYLATNAMHSPYRVAPTYVAPYLDQGIPDDRAHFYGMIANFDENLGRLRATLSELKLTQDTLLIFMGDNGTTAGIDKRNHADGFNAGMRDMKGSVYEGGHRVACFVCWPGHLQAGLQVQPLTCHRDWLPTLIELCDLTPPVGVDFDGQSIVPLLNGQDAKWPARTFFIDRQSDTLKRAGSGRFPPYAVLTDDWRLVNGELYDIKRDPGQRHDLASKQPERVRSLQAAYNEWFDDVTSHQGAYTRFVVGASEENPTTFTVRDWHPTQGQVIWQPAHLADDTRFINGFWALEVRRAGLYQVCLSRYPDDNRKPMGAIQAKLKIGDQVRSRQIRPEDESVCFQLMLEQGPVVLQTWLTDQKTKQDRGAYFVTCRYLPDDGATR